jgi:diguanylate cyclase (GGDEF)-like protein
MLLNDPITLLLVLIPFGLMTLVMLCLSYAGISKSNAPLHWWVAGDLFLAAYRGVPLLQAGVLDERFSALWVLSPTLTFLLNGLLLQLAMTAHTRALATLWQGPTGRLQQMRELLALPLLQTAGCLVLLHSSWLLPWFFLMLALSVARQLQLTWPLHTRFRGAWGLIFGQGVIVLFHIWNASNLSLNPIPPLAFDEPDMFSLPALCIDFLVSFLFTLSFALCLQEQLRQQITQLSITDALTGALNRRGAAPILLREWAKASSERYPMAVAMIDLDHFKSINDQFGHALGDSALQAFANTVERLKRQSDVFVRWGGEEFLLVFPRTDLQQAQAFMRRLREALHTQQPEPELPFKVSFSAGLADLESAGKRDDFEGLLRVVDKALYRAKQQRGGVEVVEAADL